MDTGSVADGILKGTFTAGILAVTAAFDTLAFDTLAVDTLAFDTLAHDIYIECIVFDL
jgi:hypothetical protein